MYLDIYFIIAHLLLGFVLHDITVNSRMSKCPPPQYLFQSSVMNFRHFKMSKFLVDSLVNQRHDGIICFSLKTVSFKQHKQRDMHNY